MSQETAVPDPPNTLGGIAGDTEPDHPNTTAHIVKSLIPGQDLTRTVIPPWFLEPRSLLERWADVLMHPELLLGVAMLGSPQERLTAVARWFLSGFHYKTTGVKKPFNPIIGETFACCWPHEDGSRTQFVSEQVSHHPPVSAIHFFNKERHVSANARIWTKSGFELPQSSVSKMDGACVLTLTNLGEEYWLTFPTFFANNLLIGTLRMEIGGTAHVVCRATGLRAEITFNQLGMFSSASVQNSLDGKIVEDGRLKTEGRITEGGGKVLATFKGHWDKAIRLEAVGGGGGGGGAPWLDLAAMPVAPKYVLPLPEQGPWESRKLWRHATVELMKRPAVDWSAVDREKGQLEQEQRQVPCHAAKPGASGHKAWENKLFAKKSFSCPLTGADKELYVFTKAVEGASLDLLELSRTLPDVRGGLGHSGAEPAVMEATRAVKISERRAADWAAEQY